MSDRNLLANVKRIVVKVGSSTLTRDGVLRPRKFGDLARQISSLLDEGREVILVSSGAIAIGTNKLALQRPARSIPEMQAAAAVGQIGLLELYQRRFDDRGRNVAQILLTRVGLEDRERFLNARHTLLELLKLGVVPIVNENDTVSTEEIRFGDNDNLSANIVSLVEADLLIILTDVDGLYREPPVSGRPRPALYDVVERITPDIEAASQGSDSAFGRGGMITKLEAVKAASRSGAAIIVCNGSTPDIIRRAVAGEKVGTLFLPRERMASRKHWVAFTNKTRGGLRLDSGASRAIVQGGRSLLPAGVTKVLGKFAIGDSVACQDPRGREIARGLSAYASADVERIKGLSTRQIAQVLGYSNGDELIHRDDLVVLEE